MYICEHCGRHLKNKYTNCPACGGTSFKSIQNIGEEIIREPPKDGYIVNLKNLKLEKKSYKPLAVIALWCLISGVFFCVPFIGIGVSKGDSGTSWKWTQYIFLIAGLFFLYKIIQVVFKFGKMSSKIVNNSDTAINRVKYLSEHGILIKNLKYTIKPTNKNSSGPMTNYKIQVIYEIEKGKTMCFESEPKYLTALGRDDGTVDLLVDPNDYTNYFIDFEIY